MGEYPNEPTEADVAMWERTADGVCSLGDNRRLSILNDQGIPEEGEWATTRDEGTDL